MSKVITIIGNANSGKTTLAYFLANKLAYGGRRVIVINTNSEHPDIQYILPDNKKSNHKSLGRVLALAIINEKDIYDNMLFFDNVDIGLLCYGTNETKRTYPEISKSNLTILFDILKEMVDFIIVDTSTAFNNIDNLAIDISDHKICLTTANLKGLSFRNTLSEDEKNYTNILYSDNPYNPYEDIKGTFSYRVQYELPFCKTLQQIYNGETLNNLDCSKHYGIMVEKIAREVIEVE